MSSGEAVLEWKCCQRIGLVDRLILIKVIYCLCLDPIKFHTFTDDILHYSLGTTWDYKHEPFRIYLFIYF